MMLFAIVSTATARDVPENTLPTAKARAVDQAVHSAMIEQKLVGLAIGILHQGRVTYLKAIRRRQSRAERSRYGRHQIQLGLEL